jgi:hypothetical protein
VICTNSGAVDHQLDATVEFHQRRPYLEGIHGEIVLACVRLLCNPNGDDHDMDSILSEDSNIPARNTILSQLASCQRIEILFLVARNKNMVTMIPSLESQKLRVLSQVVVRWYHAILCKLREDQ